MLANAKANEWLSVSKQMSVYSLKNILYQSK